MITDTVSRLRNVKEILGAFQPEEMLKDMAVESFYLEHVDAEEVLAVARPHLGLATGETIGIDVSLSSDPTGKNLFVTGVEDKVKLIERLIASIDKPEMDTGTTDVDAELRSHLVDGGNLDTVYDVLQTLLAGKPVRLSTDEDAGSIVALAPPSIQEEIAATVSQLQASDADFEVIPLRTIDPYFAISLLEQMLDLPDEYDDPDDIDPDAPKIDADPSGKRLFVRAKQSQIDQIKKIVEGLDSRGGRSSQSSDGDNEEVRVFPLSGDQAEELLRTAARFWQGDNPLILYRSTVDPQSDATERVVSGRSAGGKTLTSRRGKMSELRDERWMTANPDGDAPAIRCQLTERGLLMQSDDGAALDRFEDHLRSILGPAEGVPSPPIVFYLKYTKPDAALRMLSELLDGGEIVQEGTTTKLVNGYVSSSSNSYLGSLVSSSEGTTTLMAGSITVVADTRLNRLIAQGTTADIEMIEEYLSIIDKDTSITSVETYGQSHVIELINTDASEVAAALKEAFAGRVQSGGAAGNPGGGGRGDARDPRRRGDDDDDRRRRNDDDDERRRGPGGSAGGGTQDREPKMTIAVHEKSNSLIVTAPDQLFEQVENLARSIDTRGEETIEVIAPANGELIQSVLQQVMLGEEGSSYGRSSYRRRRDRDDD